MNFINNFVEALKESVSFLLKILELLQFDLVLPLFQFEFLFFFHNVLLLLFEFLLDVSVDKLNLLQLLDFF
jgi:hypothetical protein